MDWNAGLFHASTDDGGLLEFATGAPGLTLEETRLVLGVSKSLSDSLSVSAGMIRTDYDLFLNVARSEIYIGASTQLAGIDLSGTVFFNQSDSWSGDAYYEISASYHHCMGDGLGATLAVTYGNWDEDPVTGLLNALNNNNPPLAPLEDVDFVTISATLDKDFGGGLSGSLGVTHQIADETALTDDETVVGASVTFSF